MIHESSRGVVVRTDTLENQALHLTAVSLWEVQMLHAKVQRSRAVTLWKVR